ncbi:MAG: hypothetical protein WDN46_14410 [Methylocella sp.]
MGEVIRERDKLRETIAAKDADLALMREALEPFARTPWLSEIEEDDLVIYSNGGQVLTWGDLRRARAALQASKEKA